MATSPIVWSRLRFDELYSRVLSRLFKAQHAARIGTSIN